MDQFPNELDIVPPTDQKTLEWITVLSAARRDFRLSRKDGAWTIHIRSDHYSRAMAEIEAYELSEARVAARVGPGTPLGFPFPSDALSAAWVVAALVVCFALTGPAEPHTPAYQAGAADAERIVHGEWWRVVTALTLHADTPHLTSNLLAVSCLGYFVCRLVGSGLGWFLILCSGALGNAVEALIVRTAHASVGASTAVFGALGLLAAHGAIRNYFVAGRYWGVWSRTWIPVGAGLALLAICGTAPGADLTAHALGFAAGFVLAIPFSAREFDWIRGPLQTATKFATAIAVAGAWWMALHP